MGKLFFSSSKRILGFWEKREIHGTRKDTEDTTLLQSEEDMMRTIRALPFVTKLSPVGARNSHGHGYRVSLRCPSCEEYGSCGKKQEPPVQVSSRHPTLHACLQEILKRLQEKHGKCVEALTQKAAADAQAAAAVHTPSVLEAMMLFQQAQKHAHTAQDRAKDSQDQVKPAKKVALESEKDNDAAQKELQELQRVMEPKRARRNAFSWHSGALLYAKVQLLVYGLFSGVRAWT
jgi:hypothetical protein